MVALNFRAGDVAAARDCYTDAAFARLKERGATEYDPITPRGSGFVTGSDADPFGDILGIVDNPHYAEILGSHAE
jgi:hypothetical protein